MTAHSTTDLQPGDFVQHPEKGRGIIDRTLVQQLGVYYMRDGGSFAWTSDFTGWERVETVRPGHVQVRVDDLDNAHTIASWAEWAGCDTVEEACKRIGQAFVAQQVGQAQRAESSPPAVEPEIVGDGCECWVTPEHMWTTYGSAVEPGSQVEYNSRCPKHGEKPTSTTVTLPCPDCGEAITREVRPVRMEFSRTPKWSLEFLRRPGAVGERSHACPPAQPDEPQEFGAKATVAQADGHIERWLNMHAPPQGRRGWLTWDARDTAGSTPGQSKWADWGEIIQRGTVTLGWDE